MSYTYNLVQTGVALFVPFGDQLPGMSSQDEPVSKKSERARIQTAKQIKKAVKAGQLDPSYEEKANKMKVKGEKKLRDHTYNKSQYVYDQIGKTSGIVDAIIPGAGFVTNTIAQAGKVKNLVEYGNQSPSYTDTLKKVGVATATVVAGATTPLWMPIVAPYLTAPVIVGAAGTVLGSALTLDGYSYIRG